MVLLACTSAGIQITIVLLAFTVFSFLPNRSALPRNFLQQVSHTVGCIPANKASIASCLSRTLTVFYSSAWNAQSSKLTADLSAHTVGAGRLLIVMSMNNITGPTNTRTEPGYKSNCAQQGDVGEL